VIDAGPDPGRAERPGPPDPVAGFARRVVLGTSLADKLDPPPAGLTVSAGGRPERLPGPGRPPRLAMRPGREVSVPPLAGMRDPAQRARIVHALANHELQAAELFAWALLAFADAPRGFRTGLLKICTDEQRHCRAYLERAADLGLEFGDCPVTGHFWNQLERLATPVGFVCTMGLTFENANLDFAAEYAAAAAAAGDHATARVLREIQDDEIDHVRFAATWLARLVPDRSVWQAYNQVVQFPLGPHRARGVSFDAEARRRAGLDDEFVAGLAAARPRRPGGEPR